MKPENLLIFRNYSVKLGDFGVSIKIPHTKGLDDYIGDLKGFTEGYSDPEFINHCK